ncbi:M4 family metallopeptidase [Pseudomonas sp. UL073]|uniref:Neutral metalloproteinase n=1 Tax=Zestomonas insulae TaxID=2809017 RepID=A0ABS2I907_9GAMM|nr:M4 family metallopeptidase [Pseudomonas insulae]MBM7059470.1 M4 family metallopeptidase [Pseudomonas insulae]
MCTRDPLQCFIPPYIIEHLAQSADPAVRCRAIANLAASRAFLTVRTTAQAMPRLLVNRSPTRTRHRLIYDAQGGDRLPGSLVRSEGQAAGADAAVNEAYDGSGITYDFFQQLFQRNSLDDNGMSLVSTVHVAEVDYCGEFTPMNNAYWNGEQMAYGDGDRSVFRRFTGALDVIAHELSHGIQSFTSNLVYSGQSGALNEHFADVFGILVRQWSAGESVEHSDWLIGKEVLVPAPTRRAIRSMAAPGTAYRDDPELGSDPQPAHMEQFYSGPRDNGGVHLNSGIPNRAFVLAAQAIGGNAWEVTGRIWYETLLQLTSTSRFEDCARVSLQVAAQRHYKADVRKAVKAAWQQVGVAV